MGVWIAILIVLFVLGSMMALKPSGIDQRLDKLRMTARRMQLNPKLVACPSWILGADMHQGRGMIGQYGIVMDSVKLPRARYRAIAGQWRADSDYEVTMTDTPRPLTIPTRTRSASAQTLQKPDTAFGLDNTPLDLPASIAPFVKALVVQANSIIIYWDDVSYVRPATNPTYKSSQIESDLAVLKAQLATWARLLQG